MSNGPSNIYKLSLILKDTEECHLLIENFVNIFFVTSLSVSLHNLLYFYIYIKSKGIYQPENLMSNGSSRHDDTAQVK